MYCAPGASSGLISGSLDRLMQGAAAGPKDGRNTYIYLGVKRWNRVDLIPRTP